MIQTVNVNVAAQPTSGGPESFLVLSQNENGRQIRFRILGDDLPAGCTATFSGTKPDGTVYSASGTIDGNFVLLDEEIQMTAVSGRWDAKLSIAKGTENIMTSLIRVTVVADAVSGDSIPSDSELDGIVAECRSYAEAAKNEAYGSPLTASTAAAMTDQSRVYVYTGSESGMTAGHWYYYNGTAWADGGVYNSVAVDTDTTLSISGMAADAKETGNKISQIKEDFTDMVNSAYVTDSDSGSVAHFTDGADGVPMKSVKVNIEPIQSGSGDPSPTNVRPISGYDSVKVNRCGRNFVKNKAQSRTVNGVTFTRNEDGTFSLSETSTATSSAMIYFAIEESTYPSNQFAVMKKTIPNGTYRIMPSGSQYVNVQLFGYNSNSDYGVLQYANTKVATVVVDDTYKYNNVRIVLQPSNGVSFDGITIKPCILLASDTDDTYEPYNGDTYTVSLSSAGTVYGGTLDVISGELVVDRAIVDLGSLSWTYSAPRFYSGSVTDGITPSDTGDLNAVCEKYALYETGALANQPDLSFFVNSSKMSEVAKRIVIRDSNYTDAGSLKTALNGVHLVYTLATPLTYQLSAQEIKSLLGINNVWSDAGDMDVEYRADTKLYIDKRLGV